MVRPSADVIGHCLQAVITDPLAVDSRHRIIGMAHDQVDGHLVASLAADRLENVPERLEAPPLAVQARRIKQFAELSGNRVGRSIPCPPRAVLGDKNQPLVIVTLGRRTLGQCRFKGFDG